jgi:hypothetical protein
MFKKLAALAVILVVLAYGMGLFEKADPDARAREVIQNRAKPVPMKVIADLAGCMATNTCKLPTTRLVESGQNYWSVTIKDAYGDMQYLTDGATLKVMVTPPAKDGLEWPILMEDTGTGLVQRIGRLDEKTRQPLLLTVGDPRFAVELAAAQALYYLAMLSAAKEIVPEPRSGPAT